MNGLLNFKKRSKVVTEDENKAASHYRPKGNGNSAQKMLLVRTWMVHFPLTNSP